MGGSGDTGHLSGKNNFAANFYIKRKAKFIFFYFFYGNKLNSFVCRATSANEIFTKTFPKRSNIASGDLRWHRV